MKTIWKWVLGITIGLLVVAIAVPLIMHGVMANYGFGMGGIQNGWQHPSVPGFNGEFGGRDFHHNGMHRGFGNYGPMSYGFMFFGGLMRLVPLALLALLVLGAYQLGKKSGIKSNTVPATVPAAVESTVPAENPAPVVEETQSQVSGEPTQN